MQFQYFWDHLFHRSITIKAIQILIIILFYSIIISTISIISIAFLGGTTSQEMFYSHLIIASSSTSQNLPGKKKTIDPFSIQQKYNHLEFQSKGPPLSGINWDIHHVSQWTSEKHHTTIIKSSLHQNCLKSKKEILNALKQNKSICVYYTGHGHQNGDLAIETIQNHFADRITPLEFFEHLPYNQTSFLFIDSCYSGKFIRKCEQIKNRPFVIICSSGENEISNDVKDHGGVLIWLWTNRLDESKNYRKKEMCSILIEQKGMFLMGDAQKAEFITIEVCQKWWFCGK